MSFLPIYIGSLMTLLCIASASDIPVTVEGKESNVSSVTTVFLPPSLQHSEETSKTPSDEFLMDEPSGDLKSTKEDYDKLLAEFEERKAAYTKDKEEFDSKKNKDEEELAKMDSILKETETLEKEVEEKRNILEKLKTDISEEQRALEEERKKFEELKKRKDEIEKKEAELKPLLMKLAELEASVKENLGECIEVPQVLKDFWGDVHPDTRLCIKT